MSTTTFPTTTPLLVAFAVTGLGSYVRLSRGGAQGHRFEKEVLRAGEFELPDGRHLVVVVDRAEAEKRRARRELAASLEELAEQTNAAINGGRRVWFPEGGPGIPSHNSVASTNRGFWSPDFRVEGDRLKGVVEVLDPAFAAKVERGTVADVSAAIQWGDGTAVLEHVCATANPVITGLASFVQLAKEVLVDPKAKAKGEPADATETDDEGAEDESGEAMPPATMSNGDARKVLASFYGLSHESKWDKIVGAARDACLGKAAAGSPAGAAMAKLARDAEERVEKSLGERVKALETRAADEKKKHAAELVNLAREAGAPHGVLLSKEEGDLIVEYVGSVDAKLERAGRALLDKHNASVDTARKGRSIAGGRLVPNTGLKAEPKADLERHSDAKAMLEGQGYTVETDKDGRITGAKTPDGRLAKIHPALLGQ